MQKLELKTKLLKASIRKHQTVTDDFNIRLADLKEGEQNVNDEEFDGGRSAQKAQMDAEVMLLNDQLQFAREEMDLLQKIKSKNDTLMGLGALGAVVVTDKATFFVSTSIEQFKVDRKTFVGLSTKSPLFKAMKGKQKGDHFSFNDITYHIEEIF